MDDSFRSMMDQVPEELRDVLTEDMLPLLPMIFEQAFASLPPEHMTTLENAHDKEGTLDFQEVMDAHPDLAEAFGRNLFGLLNQPPEYREDSIRSMIAIRSYEETGHRQFLDEAIEYLEKIRSLHIFWSDHEQARPVVLGNSAACYLWRYELTGATEDLDLSLELFEQVIMATPEDHALLPGRLQNRASALESRYERFGTPDDLSKAVSDLRRAVNSTSELSPYLPKYLDGLGNALRKLYAREGDLLILDEALRAYWNAVTKTPEEDPHLPGFLNNLATGYQDLFDRTKNREDFDEALRLLERTVELAQPGSPKSTLYLANLAGSLRTKFLYTRDPEDLNRSIDTYRRTVEEASPESVAFPGFLSGLGSALFTRAALNEDPQDLEEATRKLRRSVELCPEFSPAKVVTLNNFARSLAQGYDTTGDNETLAKVREVSRLACDTSLTFNVDPEEGLRCARSWGDWEFHHEAWSEATRAYEYAEQIAERLLRVQIFRQGKELWLSEIQGVPGKTAYALAKAGDLRGAVVVLERGRARLLTEALDRDRADLERLRKLGRTDLYERYSVAVNEWTTLSDTTTASSEPRGSRPLDGVRLVETLQAKRAELDAVAKDIRGVQGYEQFQVPSSFEEVQSTAIEAPLVYLSTTSVGSLALIVTKCETCVEWLDITEQELEDLFIKTGPEGGPEGERHMFPLVGGYVYAQTVNPNHLGEALNEILPVLGDKVMSKIAERLRKIFAQKAIIIPNGQLGSVPLHAASYQLDGRTFCFLDEFDISYVPNARSLSTSRRSITRESEAPCLVGVGNPLPTSEDSLEWARFELEGVAALFGSVARPLYESEATKTNLESNVQDATYLHFACHGHFSIAYPPDSSLLLAYDEELTLEELLYGRVKIPETRLAVLSACQSAIASFSGLPDEYIGLPVGILQAGVPGVVGTLWPVDDCKTALLMVKFYELHLRGDSETDGEKLPPDKALCEAQRWLRRVDVNGLLSFLENHPAVDRALRKALRRNSEDSLPGISGDPSPGSPEPLFAEEPAFWAPFVFIGA